MAIERGSNVLSQALLSANGIGVMRGERTLFAGIDVSVCAGDLVLLRGQNGAGKTTLLRILSGVSAAESGDITRTGPHHWIGHRKGLKPHETPTTHLKHWASAWGAAPDKVNTALETVSLLRAADVPTGHLSQGQQHRTALARLLLQDRPLWLLDEPFAAMDDSGVTMIKSLIAQHCASGGALIAAVHGDYGLTPTQELTL